MRLLRALLAPSCAALIAALLACPAQARLLIEIDKATQTMTVSQDGASAAPLAGVDRAARLRHAVRPVHAVPPGEGSLQPRVDDAPMPHSIFFTKQGHAIHGTHHLRAIGRPASHGCVRLDPAMPRVLFDMVRREGLANTRVVLAGVAWMRARPRWRDRVLDERPVYQYDERPSVRPSYSGRQPYDGDRRGDDDGYPPVASPYAAPRSGYWVQHPDGSRVFVDRERDPRGLPPRPQGADGPR